MINYIENYLNGFSTLSHFTENDLETNATAILKIVSYFLFVIPIGWIAARELASLCNRVSTTPPNSSDAKRITAATPFSSPTTPPTTEAPTIPPPRDLSTQKKPFKGWNLTYFKETQPRPTVPNHLPNCSTTALSDSKWRINFPSLDSKVQVEIRGQNMFASGAEVLVNAANSHLRGGSGIDGAMHNRWNPYGYQEAQLAIFTLDPYTRQKENYPSGDAVLIELSQQAKEEETKKGTKINSVIIVNGPQPPLTADTQSRLYSSYYNSLVLAHQQGKTSIAFPSISTGIFQYPKEDASIASLHAIHDFMKEFPKTTLSQISIHFLSADQLKESGYSKVPSQSSHAE